MPRKRLGEMLLEKGLISQAHLRECLEEQKLTKEYLGVVLLRKELIREDDLLKALSEQFGIPYVVLSTQYIDWGVALNYFSRLASRQTALPIAADEWSVTVASSDPLDVTGISELENMVQPKRLKLVLVSPREIRDALSECRRRSKSSLKDLLDKE